MVDLTLRHRHRLRNKIVKNFTSKINELYNLEIDLGSSIVDSGIANNLDVLIINNEILFILIENIPYLTIRGVLKYKPKNRYVTVDMGAVRFISNGADVMSPGIVDADNNIKPDDIVWIRDEKHHQPLAIGKALMSGIEMINNTKDKAIISLHYVNDKLWNVKI